MFEYEEKQGNVVYAETMIELAKEYPVVLVENDLGGASQSLLFRDAYPDRFVDVGIAESNSVGVAAGLSDNGYIPFIHSLTPFITRRCYDQLVLSIAYSGLNCKVVGTAPGIYSQLNGGTHLSVEDAGIMRNIPRFSVVDACDNTALRGLLPEITASPDPVYVRVCRDKPIKVYGEGATFKLGKANTLRQGKDATIIANSLMVAFSLEAADMLAKQGIEVTVLDMHTIKPIDRAAVLEAASRGPIVTAENGSVLNGLGSAVSEVLAEEGAGVKLRRIGIQDRFGVVGFIEDISEALKMRPCDIADAVRAVLEK
nr:transketolase C-terminal domain-containing protein [Maliibacterium massiliense]